MLDADTKMQLIDGYIASHPLIAEAVEHLGVEAIININKTVSEVRPAPGLDVNPGFDPQRIHG